MIGNSNFLPDLPLGADFVYTVPGKLFRSSGVFRLGVYPGKLLAVLLVLPLISLFGCGSEDEIPPPNQPPTALLTSGPVEGESASYYIRISWTGSDPDGFITRYEYAVDPPAEFTETEINEGGPDVTAEMIPGTGDKPDVTRISKVVDGAVVSFEWIHTRAFSKRFRFSTLEADSAVVDGVHGPTGRFVGMHAFYVRTIDDDGAFSIPDKVAFTAETIAPESWITRPVISANVLNTGSRIVVEWEGEDPDLPESDKTPEGFRYKLIKVKTSVVLFIRPPSPDELFDDGTAWTYQPAEKLTVTLEIEEPGAHLLGVRAVDENGAVEPFLEWGRNVFRFQAFSEIRPTLTLSCEAGVFTSKSAFSQFEVEVPLDTDLNCELFCSAEVYGESCLEFRWGLDIPDVSLDEYWSDWTVNPVVPPLIFSRPGIHTLYVQARDALGNTSSLVLLANVIDFPFDREVLFVDDSFDHIYPSDSDQDEFWRSLLAGYGGFDQVFEHHSYGDLDRSFLYPQVPTLAELSRYQVLVWDSSGWGYNGSTALASVSAVNRTLRSYLNAGGKLWLSGRMTIGATLLAGNGIAGDFIYPKELNPGDFAYDFLKLHTTKLNNDKAAKPKNTLREVNPFPGRPVVYSAMFVDPTKLSPILAERSGVSHVDAVFDPILVESEDNFRGTLDSLYVYGATGNVFFDPPQPSPYHNRLCAVRWHDPDPAREHGRVQWFGFPMYYFFADQAQDTFNKSMDWFREETPGSKGFQ